MPVYLMTPPEGYEFCANCFMHNWKQPEDKSSLKPCPGCRLILYCGEACRKEHWRKVHKKHCKFLADPSKCPQSQHDAERCDDCRPPAGTGKGKRKMAVKDKKRNPASTSHVCFIKDKIFAPGLFSPHPFPVAGVGDDLLENSIIITQKLFHKLKQNPRVAKVCLVELEKIEQLLWGERMNIWSQRKLIIHNKIISFIFLQMDFSQMEDLVYSVSDKVIQGQAGKDASELWKIIQVVIELRGRITMHHQLDSLKNPTGTMLEQYQDLVKQAADNKFEVFDIAEEIIDSLSTHVVSYEDIIKKLCGGKRKQNCSFCGVKTEVTEFFETSSNRCSSVSFNSLAIRKIVCGSQDCHRKANYIYPGIDDCFKLSLAIATACNERGGTCCDFCFKLCPIDKAHRCRNCLTVMYCSKSCYLEDREEHKERYCIEDERKTKDDRPMRRQMGEMTPGKMAAVIAGSMLEINVTAVTIANETLETFKFEESKSKNGDNYDTGCEHDASIPAAATVPTVEDDGSGSATGASKTEHVKDRNTPGAGALNTEHEHGSSASGAGAAGGPSISEVD